MGSVSSIGGAIGGIAGAASGFGPAGMAIGSGVGSAIGGSFDEARDRKASKRNADKATAALDDLSMRREATYRASRTQLQGAIEDFYKQKGWPLPEVKPGAYTTRALPGEGPLYPDAGAKPQGNLSESSSSDESEAAQAIQMGGLSSPTQEQLDESGVVAEAARNTPYGAPARMTPSGPVVNLTPVAKPVISTIAPLPFDDITEEVAKRYGY